MKHYLLTWYGMTDLRAALGLEYTDAPVLSALKAGEYSDAVVLAYTDPDKAQQALVGELRDEWEEWLTDPSEAKQPLPREKAQQIIDAVSNTATGHELFEQWLSYRLESTGVEVVVQVVPHALTHLNDATGIHAAAAAAVRVALRDPDEKRVTTYVSPGTPVMAYTWALIARSNPQLSIGVISSSDPRKPPEEVELPRALLDASVRVDGAGESGVHEYDLVIHLMGEQTIPVFFGMRQFEAKQNIILTTKEYEAEARRLAKVTGVAPTPVVVPNAYKPADTRKAITKQVAKLPEDAKIAVNLTGGTKLMFAGALSASWELGLDPVYFEIKHHNVIFIRDGSQVPFVGISDVEDFLRAGDFTTVSDGRWPRDANAYRNRRLAATGEMWLRRDSLRDLYKDQRFNDFSRRYNGRPSDSVAFSFRWGSGEASLAAGSDPQLVLGGVEVGVPRERFFEFLSGGWLEDYVYSLLAPLQLEGTVRDVRIGFEAGYRDGVAGQRDRLAQEFDGVFTDGKRLWIVECKAGAVRQEAIQKLENNLKLYGGVAARGLLVSAAPIDQATRNRVSTLSAVTVIGPDELSTENLRAIVERA